MKYKFAAVALMTAALAVAPFSPANAEGHHFRGGHGGGYDGGRNGRHGGGHDDGLLLGLFAAGIAVTGAALALGEAPVAMAQPEPVYAPPPPVYYGYAPVYPQRRVVVYNYPQAYAPTAYYYAPAR